MYKANDIVLTPNGKAVLIGFAGGQRYVLHKVEWWPLDKPKPEHYKGGPNFGMWYEASEVREMSENNKVTTQQIKV